MKNKKFVCFALVLSLLFSCFTFSAYALESDIERYISEDGRTEIVFLTPTSKWTRDKILAQYTLSDPAAQEDAEKGLLCTLFGHKIETVYIYRITHRARAAAPRCLNGYYRQDSCTRCDFIEETLLSSTYIHCCS